MYTQNYTKNYEIVLTLPDDEPVKRAPVGSGQAPSGSGTGVDAWAGARSVGRLRWRQDGHRGGHGLVL
jgi:hypothetical protein